MFETVIDVYSRFEEEDFIHSITVVSAGRLTEQDCRKILLEDGHDLGMIVFDFISMRKRPSLPHFLNDEFKMAEQQFRARLKGKTC